MVCRLRGLPDPLRICQMRVLISLANTEGLHGLALNITTIPDAQEKRPDKHPASVSKH